MTCTLIFHPLFDRRKIYCEQIFNLVEPFLGLLRRFFSTPYGGHRGIGSRWHVLRSATFPGNTNGHRVRWFLAHDRRRRCQASTDRKHAYPRPTLPPVPFLRQYRSASPLSANVSLNAAIPGLGRERAGMPALFLCSEKILPQTFSCY